MDPPESHPDLAIDVQTRGWEWRDETLIQAANKSSMDTIKVGALKGTRGGRNVFKGLIPAVKAADIGLEGRSHLVMQSQQGRRLQ